MALADIFRPRWRHSDPAVRRAAVESLQDEAVLAKVGATDPDVDIRRAAVVRIRSDDLLADVTARQVDACLRREFAARLTSQAALRRFAVGDPDATLRGNLVDMLADTEVISAIAVSDPDAMVRRKAIQRLTRETETSGTTGDRVATVLAQLLGDRSLGVRIEAARSLGRMSDPRADQAARFFAGLLIEKWERNGKLEWYRQEKNWWLPDLQDAEVRLIGRASEPQLVDALVAVMVRRGDVGTAARDTLINSNPEIVFAGLQRALEQTEASDHGPYSIWPGVRSYIAETQYHGRAAFLYNLLRQAARLRYKQKHGACTDYTGEISDYIGTVVLNDSDAARSHEEILWKALLGLGQDITEAWASEDLLDRLEPNWPKGPRALQEMQAAIEVVCERRGAWQAAVGFLDRVSVEWRSSGPVRTIVEKMQARLRRDVDPVLQRLRYGTGGGDALRSFGLRAFELSLIEPDWPTTLPVDDVIAALRDQLEFYKSLTLQASTEKTVYSTACLSARFAIDREWTASGEAMEAVDWLKSVSHSRGPGYLDHGRLSAQRVLERLELYFRPRRFASETARLLWRSASEEVCGYRRSPTTEPSHAPVVVASPGWG